MEDLAARGDWEICWYDLSGKSNSGRSHSSVIKEIKIIHFHTSEQNNVTCFLSYNDKKNQNQNKKRKICFFRKKMRSKILDFDYEVTYSQENNFNDHNV